MKIDRPSAIQPIFSKTVRREKDSEANVLPQKLDGKQALRETVQRRISEIEQARTNMGEDDPQAQLLIDKFKSGKKLTASEMNYIRKHAPGMVDYIERITREREIYELGMKIAPTKADVHIVVLHASQQFEKHPNPEEREIRAKHLADAKHEYEQTEEYKEKPNSPLDQTLSEKSKVKRKQHTTHYALNAIQAYEQFKNNK